MDTLSTREPMRDDVTRMPLNLALKSGLIRWIELSEPVMNSLSAALQARKQSGFETISLRLEAQLLGDSCGSSVLRLSDGLA